MQTGTVTPDGIFACVFFKDECYLLYIKLMLSLYLSICQIAR